MALYEKGVGTPVPTPTHSVFRNNSAWIGQPKLAIATVVLGHYPDYTYTAADVGAFFFQINDPMYERLPPGEVWALNRHFLDQMCQINATFISATPFEQTRPGSWFEREVRYLHARGKSVCYRCP